MGTIDFAPLWITLKTGIVASVFSFFIGIAFAELVINTKGRVRAFWDGLLTHVAWLCGCSDHHCTPSHVQKCESGI